MIKQSKDHLLRARKDQDRVPAGSPEGGEFAGKGGGGASKSKPMTSYPRRELNPETETTSAMPSYPTNGSTQEHAEYHQKAAAHFASRNEPGIAEGHQALSEKYGKRAEKEAKKAARTAHADPASPKA